MSLDPVSGGGTVERTIQMSRELSRSGARVVILTTDAGLPGGRAKNFDGVEVITLPCLMKRYYFPKVRYGFVKKLVSESDIVHLMGHWTFINVLTYCAARQVKKPYVVCPAGALPIYGRSRIIKNIFNFIIGNKIVRNAASCIAIAVNEEAYFRSCGIEAGKISLIPNGINRDDFRDGNDNCFRGKYGLGDHRYILFVGRLNSIKGPDILLKAFCGVREKLAGYHLVFAGPDGGMLAELKNMALRLSCPDRVHFIGYLGGEDKVAAYREADLLAVPSRQEAMSIVVLEAGICGKPVLITDQCGFNDINAVNGGIIVPASVEGIQKGLIEILADRQKLQSMGMELKKYVEGSFTWKITAERYLRLYDAILSRGGVLTGKRC